MLVREGRGEERGGEGGRGEGERDRARGGGNQKVGSELQRASNLLLDFTIATPMAFTVAEKFDEG